MEHGDAQDLPSIGWETKVEELSNGTSIIEKSVQSLRPSAGSSLRFHDHEVPDCMMIKRDGRYIV